MSRTLGKAVLLKAQEVEEPVEQPDEDSPTKKKLKAAMQGSNKPRPATSLGMVFSKRNK